MNELTNVDFQLMNPDRLRRTQLKTHSSEIVDVSHRRIKKSTKKC